MKNLMFNKHSPEFKERMLTCLQMDEYSDINALYFSGGVDSTTILFALLELGRKPDLVSFELDGILSKDRIIGSDIAKYYGLNYKCINIKCDKESVLSDIKTVLPYMKYPIKTHIQCSIPFLYMSKYLSSLGHTKSFTGMAADDIHGLSKIVNMEYNLRGEESVRNMRSKTLYNAPRESDYDIWIVSKEFGGVIMKDPYRETHLTEWMLGVPYKELHLERKKSIAVDAFSDYWKLDEKNWYRPGDSLQIVSGIRELHDELLLKDPILNKNNAKGIIAVYNNIRKSMLHDNSLDNFIEQ